MNNTSSDQPRGLFTATKAAEYLGVAVSTVRAWAYLGKLPFVKLGEGKWAPLRFRWEDLEAFIDSHWFPIRG